MANEGSTPFWRSRIPSILGEWAPRVRVRVGRVRVGRVRVGRVGTYYYYYYFNYYDYYFYYYYSCSCYHY